MALKKSDLLTFKVDSEWVPSHASAHEDNVLMNSILEHAIHLSPKESFPIGKHEIRRYLNSESMPSVISAVRTFIIKRTDKDMASSFSMHILKDREGKELGIRIRKKEVAS